LSEAFESQCRILGGHLLRWLRDWGPALLSERKFVNYDGAMENDPFILFLTDTPGLVAAQEILGEDRDRLILYMRHGEFEEFSTGDPDHQFRWHVILESRFVVFEDEAETARAMRRHALRDGECFWVHRDVSTLGPAFARGGHHLWLWNGSEPQLLEEGLSTWVS